MSSMGKSITACKCKYNISFETERDVVLMNIPHETTIFLNNLHPIDIIMNYMAVAI